MHKHGINTTIDTIKQDILDIASVDSTVSEELRELYAVDLELSRELEYNKRMRDKCTSETASSSYSRLCKDILVKKTEVAKSISEIKQSQNAPDRPIYKIKIGEFPVVKNKEEEEDEK